MIDRGIERHFTKMAAMGRRFQLGDLYDYRNDQLLTGKLELCHVFKMIMSDNIYDFSVTK
jgi:hypothetical protein